MLLNVKEEEEIACERAQELGPFWPESHQSNREQQVCHTFLVSLMAKVKIKQQGFWMIRKKRKVLNYKYYPKEKERANKERIREGGGELEGRSNTYKQGSISSE